MSVCRDSSCLAAPSPPITRARTQRQKRSLEEETRRCSARAGLARGGRSNCVRVRKPGHCPRTGEHENSGTSIDFVFRHSSLRSDRPSGHSASSRVGHGRLPVEDPDGGLRTTHPAPFRDANLERRRRGARQVTRARLLPPKTGGARDAGDARLLGRVQRRRRPPAQALHRGRLAAHRRTERCVAVADARYASAPLSLAAFAHSCHASAD